MLKAFPLIGLITLSILTGCGQSGALYLPSDQKVSLDPFYEEQAMSPLPFETAK